MEGICEIKGLSKINCYFIYLIFLIKKYWVHRGKGLRGISYYDKISCKDILYKLEYSQYFIVTINGV